MGGEGGTFIIGPRRHLASLRCCWRSALKQTNLWPEIVHKVLVNART